MQVIIFGATGSLGHSIKLYRLETIESRINYINEHLVVRARIAVKQEDYKCSWLRNMLDKKIC